MNDGEGSLPLGCLLGFFGGCLGLIVSFFLGSNTRNGAVMGFVISIVVMGVLGVLSALLQIAFN